MAGALRAFFGILMWVSNCTFSDPCWHSAADRNWSHRSGDGSLGPMNSPFFLGMLLCY